MSEIFIQRTSAVQQLKEFESQIQRKGPGSEMPGFGKVLSEALNEVDAAQKTSNDQVQKVLSGDIQDVHSAMIALQKADLSFQMMVQVRNKLIDAYHEIMRMQV